MKLKTDFDIGDSVYFLWDKKILNGTIGRIHVKIEKEIDIEYRVDFKKEDIKEFRLSSCEWMKGKFLATSKKELLDIL